VLTRLACRCHCSFTDYCVRVCLPYSSAPLSDIPSSSPEESQALYPRISRHWIIIDYCVFWTQHVTSKELMKDHLKLISVVVLQLGSTHTRYTKCQKRKQSTQSIDTQASLTHTHARTHARTHAHTQPLYYLSFHLSSLFPPSLAYHIPPLLVSFSLNRS